ncbi:hypothetical protein FRC06_011888, partial [Ceratobasidium sp. 370]
MWIGPIPLDISCLTVPEQILVSLYHPRSYVYNLYARDMWGFVGNLSLLQAGLKGNVTTYELNMPHVVRMLEGKLMPRPTSILASMIAVSFIGPGRVPKSCLRRTFRVRRAVVLAAIRCLKAVTKHPGYADIEISEDALAQLPEDNVPVEILVAIRHEENVERAQQEADSYLNNESAGPGVAQNPLGQNVVAVEDLGNNATDNIPDVIPLQFLATIDTDLSKVSTEELLLHALANTDSSGNNEGGYAKWQAMMAARLQMRRKDFDEATRLFSTLTRADLAAAAKAEANGGKVEDPKILLLRRLIHCGGAKVMGSDHSRASYCSEIWSTMLNLNPPSLWVTINPIDLHDPIVQVLVGEQIDMDAFCTTAGPDREQPAANAAKDPYVTAQFFNILINLILKKLFGINSAGRTVNTTMGVLGRLRAYYSAVEAQGRGSLHLHMLLWLENAPSSEQMQSMLQTEEFRQRVADYVDANVRAHLDELTAEGIKEMDCEPELSWSRPPNPDSPTYKEDLTTRERRLSRSQQVHTCKKSTCLIYHPHLREWSDGTITPKCTYGYLNNWNPSVLIYGASNNDIKFIGNGFEVRAIIWYITAYQTKKQQRSFNWSALLAGALAYHFKGTDYLHDLRERNRLFIFRCLHILNRQMEQSSQQAMSYLLGFGDKFCSHWYTPPYWSSIAVEILRAWPDIKKAAAVRKTETASQGSPEQENGGSDSDSDPEDGDANQDKDKENEEVVLEALPTGALVFRSQLTDYKYHGHEFAHMSFVSFVADTWEDDYHPSGDVCNGTSSSTTRGAPRHARSQYLDGHPKSASRQRVLHAAGHNVLPNVVGPYLPQNDDPDTYPFYCASMLALLKPWRNIRELLPPGGSWANAFSTFLSSATKRERDFISGVQYYYQCKDAVTANVSTDLFDGSVDERLGNGNEVGLTLLEPTEAEKQAYIESKQNPRELLHAAEAIAIARGTGLFRSHLEHSWSFASPCAQVATREDLRKISAWREAMAHDAVSRKTRRLEVEVSLSQSEDTVMPAPVSPLSVLPQSQGSVVAEPIVEEFIQPFETQHLKPDQSRAYGIIEKHLATNLAGQSPNQLLMQIQGEGGTGKSM